MTVNNETATNDSFGIVNSDLDLFNSYNGKINSKERQTL